MTLLDQYLPRYDFVERHQREAKAGADDCFDALWNLDFRRSPLVTLLLRLRELPYRLSNRDFETEGLGLTLADMMETGFVLLADDRPRELVMGLAGRFWTPSPQLERLTPEEYVAFDRPGHAKVATNFLMEPRSPDSTLMTTETRILCLDQKARSSFRRYWTIIRPFSGLIRIEWLRLAARAAEARQA